MNYPVDFLVYIEKITIIIKVITYSYLGPQVGTLFQFYLEIITSKAEHFFPGLCLTLKECIRMAFSAEAVTMICFA